MSVVPGFPYDPDSSSTPATARSWALQAYPGVKRGPVPEGIPEIIETDNAPMSGVELIALERRTQGGRAWKVAVPAADDAPPVLVDLREEAVLDLMLSEGVSAGGVLNGSYLWVRGGVGGSPIRLVRVGSREHQEAARRMTDIERAAKGEATHAPGLVFWSGVHVYLYAGPAVVPVAAPADRKPRGSKVQSLPGSKVQSLPGSTRKGAPTLHVFVNLTHYSLATFVAGVPQSGPGAWSSVGTTLLDRAARFVVDPDAQRALLESLRASTTPTTDPYRDISDAFHVWEKLYPNTGDVGHAEPPEGYASAADGGWVDLVRDAMRTITPKLRQMDWRGSTSSVRPYTPEEWVDVLRGRLRTLNMAAPGRPAPPLAEHPGWEALGDAILAAEAPPAK